ncbi:MAG: hypothetical protein WBW98_19010 [Candidatus Sulfotelmatobacter sp.]|jgi:hypothetical protein
MSTILRYASALAIAFALLIFSPASSFAHAAQAGDPKVDPKTVSVVDAGLGPCTADFIITDAAGAPVYAANIRVHIAYGFMNLHKFDLEVGTNADGRARFIGLPENPKQGLFFRASEADREGSAFDNPSKTCKAQFTVVLRKKAQE